MKDQKCRCTDHTRRDFLFKSAAGLGSLALLDLFGSGTSGLSWHSYLTV
jgi:hypothetical protein